MKYGFRSVTMDEIAAQSGVSKKTIYQYFADKDELVEAIMKAEIEFMQHECRVQMHDAENAVEEVMMDMRNMESVMESMNPQIVFDLEKFYPVTFEKFKKHKHTFLLDVIKKNLMRGIKEELYRPDINADITAKFRLESAFIAFNQELFPYGKYSLLQVTKELYYLYMHSICTVKGKKLLEKYIHQNEKQKTVNV
ncbi:MAG TPA: TetR/AcrR family transcriptional regulator [Chitinophagaceae bacterium]|nr:TetR/AcrR family transcriptional regulator [Chitinophagaceae bacterium]